MPNATQAKSVSGEELSIVESAAKLTACHMRHLQATTPRAVQRIASDVSPASVKLLAIFAEADHGGRPPLPRGMPATAAQMWRLAEANRVTEKPLEKQTGILNGDHLIGLGLKPSPRFKEILRKALVAEVEGAFGDEASAVAWARVELEN